MPSAPDDLRLAAVACGDLPALPGDAPRLARLRRVESALAAAAGVPAVPPAGLAAATVARLPVTTPRRAWRGPGDLTPAFNVAAVLLVGLLTVGLAAAGVTKVREEARAAECRNRLRVTHAALDGYADTHADRFPEAGTALVPTAGAAFAELARAGQLPAVPADAGTCPAGGAYAYTLGYQTPSGRVVGLRRTDAGDLAPVAADRPGAAHAAGRAVLFVGGNVRVATTAAVGPFGDDIDRNQLGLTRAGLHRDDASLGGPADCP